MSKSKTVSRGNTDDGRKAKRRKLDRKAAPGDVPQTQQALQQVLTFHQDSPNELRHGIGLFKNFLDSLLYDEQSPNKEHQWEILRNYCKSQQIQGHGQGPSPFSNIVETWSFAEQSNNDSLLSSVPSVLALFLRTVSTDLQLRDFGLALCKSLLQKDQLRLFSKGLAAPKIKEHLISPCLRLLTEIVSFDGGTLASAVFARRDTTYKRLDVFLSMRKNPSGDPEEDRRRPSVRSTAVRYVLANLRFQSASAKADMLSQGKMWKVFFDDMRADPRDLLIDILVCLEKTILKDNLIPRLSKGRYLNQWHLSKIAALFAYKSDTNSECEGKSIPELVKDFLLAACTDPSNGVLATQTGWYSHGTHADCPLAADEEGDIIELGLDSSSYDDSHGEEMLVRNTTLSNFIQSLRPEADTLQMELVLSIFTAAPELVAHYFSKKPAFVSEPKETPAWLGQSAFLFSTVCLPVPENCGWKEGLAPMPPPMPIALESILPRPLTQKTLTRCLNQSSDIITLFALRCIKQSLQKLAQVLEIYSSASGLGSHLWAQSSTKLKDEFCSRAPKMKDIIATFRATSKSSSAQHEAVLETLVLYYEVLPSVALEEKLDVSLSLIDLLESMATSGDTEPEKDSMLTQLNLLLVIARCSPSVRWWHKPEVLDLTPFSTILKVVSERPKDLNLHKTRSLLESILIENGIVSNAKLSRAALFRSFESTESWSPPQPAFAFLDNCVTRLTQKPVHYLDLYDAWKSKAATDGSVSLLHIVAVEQWPFVTKAGKEEVIAAWLARYLGYSKQAGENKSLLSLIRDQMADATSKKEVRSVFKKAFKQDRPEVLAILEPEDDEADIPARDPDLKKETPHTTLEEMFGTVPTQAISAGALTKWATTDEEEAVQLGYVGELTMCFCSENEEVRRNAYFNVKSMMQRLEQSTYSEAQTIYLLLGEVAETAKDLQFSVLPHIFGELAARSVSVLANPLHQMYAKVNKYLNKGPKWDIAKMPSYWIDRTILREPEQGAGHVEEAGWLLDLLVSGLRTEEDMDLFRQCNVFERCLSFYTAPGLNRDLRKRVLHLVYRASEVGGSTTLITRAGILSWLQAQAALLDGNDVILQQLVRRLYETCDRERVETWGGASLVRALRQIQRE